MKYLGMLTPSTSSQTRGRLVASPALLAISTLLFMNALHGHASATTDSLDIQAETEEVPSAATTLASSVVEETPFEAPSSGLVDEEEEATILNDILEAIRAKSGSDQVPISFDREDLAGLVFDEVESSVTEPETAATTETPTSQTDTDASATIGDTEVSESTAVEEIQDSGLHADVPIPADPIDNSILETVEEVIAEDIASHVDADDLDDFLSELFEGSDPLEELTPEPEVPPPPPPPVQTPLTPEEIAERKRLRAIETANRRADITGRHTKWEQELEAKGTEEASNLIVALLELRNTVAQDVKTNKEITALLDGLEAEANKALKGVEAFFEKRLAKANSDGGKIADSVVKTWESVVAKVEQKVKEKTIHVESEMQEYYQAYVEEEASKVKQAIKNVENFADRAQADIGMDYSWLDDVTTKDWVRYHDLQRTAKRFAGVYESIFNGTHPQMPSNEVVTALKEVQAEIAEIGDGFDHLLGNLQRRASRIINGEAEEEVIGLGEEDLVYPNDEEQEEDVPVLGLGGGVNHPAAPHVEL